jgi:alpha-1,3-rhamnosyl/mannosyltransferase
LRALIGPSLQQGSGQHVGLDGAPHLSPRPAPHPALHVDTFFARHWLGPRETLALQTANQPANKLPQASLARSRLWRDLLRHIPGVRELNRSLQAHYFNKGCSKLKPLLYHEPNFIAFPFNGPTVVTVHDLSFIRHPETHPTDRVRFMNRWIESSLQRAQAVVVVSDFVRQELLSVFGDWVVKKTHVVFNGVSEAFRPWSADETQPVLASHGLSHGRYLLTLGTLEPRKNLSSLLRAYALLPARIKAQYPLVIVGPQGWRGAELKGLAQQMRHENIRWLGYCSNEERPLLYAGARAFAYPSVYEGFGLPALEAMASGLPTLVGPSLAVQEVCGDAGCVVDTLNSQAFAEVLSAVMEDDRLNQSLRQKSLQRAAHFSWTLAAEKLLGVYSPLLRAAL